jgi:hypothetical protein
MPFTLSHAAAALPFRRTRLVFPAVVVGSFAPDFEYFVRLGPWGKFGHSLIGVFAFDLPLALLTLGLFERYAQEPLWAWLPRGFRQRFPRNGHAPSRQTIGQWSLVVLSILVGIATHILWDAFTHATYWPYQHIHLLHDSFGLPLAGAVPAYLLLQQVSSVFGLVVLLIWIQRQPKVAAPPPGQGDSPSAERDHRVLTGLATLALAVGGLRGLVNVGFPDDVRKLADLIAEATITGISAFWVGLVVYGVMRQRLRQRWPRHDDPTSGTTRWDIGGRTPEG